MRARAKPLFLRTVFQILFRISQSNGKNENPKTDISALKSVFGFRVRLQIRNPDFKIEIQISQSNAPLRKMRPPPPSPRLWVLQSHRLKKYLIAFHFLIQFFLHLVL